jgi:hypothetical protein
MPIETGFVSLHGEIVTAEEATEESVYDGGRVSYQYAVDAGYCVYREPFGMIVDMDRDRFGNTILSDADYAEREGWWCP